MNVTIMSMKMVMLSLKLGAAKMKSKSTVFGCGMKPVTNDVRWFAPAAVKVLEEL